MVQKVYFVCASAQGEIAAAKVEEEEPESEIEGILE